MTLVLHFTVNEHLPWHDAGVFPVHLTQISEAVVQGPGSVLELYLVLQEDLTGQAGKALDVPPHSVRHRVQSKGCLQIVERLQKMLCLHVGTKAVNYFFWTLFLVEMQYKKNELHLLLALFSLAFVWTFYWRIKMKPPADLDQREDHTSLAG